VDDQPYAPATLPLGKRHGTHFLHEAGWATQPFCTGGENLAPTSVRSPHGPACSKSLCRLSCRSSHCNYRRIVILDTFKTTLCKTHLNTRSHTRENRLLPLSCPSVCLSFCLCGCTSSNPSRRIFVKFYVGDFYENLLRESKFG